MLKLLKELKTKDRLLALCCLLLVGGQVYLDLKLPDYTKQVTILISQQSENIPEYFTAGGKMLSLALASALLSIIVGYFAAMIAADFSFTVREKVFLKVSDLGAAEIKKFSTASLITRTTNDITQIQMVIAMGLQVMIKAPIMAVWAVMKIVGKSWELSVVTAGAVVIILVCLLCIMAAVFPKFKIVQSQVDDMNRVTRENLTGLRVIRAFNAEEYQSEKFEEASTNLMKTQMFTQRCMALVFPIMTLVQSLLSLIIYWLGAYLIDNINVPLNGNLYEVMQGLLARANLLGDVVVFNSYALYVIMSFLMLVMIFMIMPRASVSAARINEVLDSQVSVKEGSYEKSGNEARGTLEFKNVYFRYPDASEDCIKDISFRAEHGETVAIIGATGSSKSTLVGLAARLYDVTEGQVLLDGVDIREYTFNNLYNKIGYIQQKALLFADTIENNISFGECGHEITKENVEEALDIAQAGDFVSSLDRGIESPISQGGNNVSGGQKQRLAIARAIARKPEILIFDDSFSALDYKTDKAFRARLQTDLKDTTCLIVAQRIGTIRNADRIIVLEDGAAVGIGTHEELMKNCEVYKEIALSQLSAEELEEGIRADHIRENARGSHLSVEEAKEGSSMTDKNGSIFKNGGDC